jgi:hypothetical protein
MEVRDEILDLIKQVDRQPHSELEALEWLLLLQWIERDFFSIERDKPKIMDRAKYLSILRARLTAVRAKAIDTCPTFMSIRQYTLLMNKWKDLQNVGISAVPNSGAETGEKPPQLVTDALTNLVANHMNFSRGFPALSWPRNDTRLEINQVVHKTEIDDAGQQEESQG